MRGKPRPRQADVSPFRGPGGVMLNAECRMLNAEYFFENSWIIYGNLCFIEMNADECRMLNYE
jgi:hypothetical protein